MTILAWAAVDTSDWNGDASANPATGVGGVDLTPVGSNALMPMAHTSGSATQTFNFGQSAFTYAVPSGYTSGWPGSGAGGFTAFDPTKNAGTGAVTLSNNNRTVAVSGFGPAGTQVLTADGKTTGAYYFEVHYDSHGGIADFVAAGIGRVYPGIDYSSFFDNTTPGYYGGADNNGGIALGSSYPFFAPDTYHDYFGALKVLLASSPPTTWFNYAVGSTIRFAINFAFTPPVGNQITGIGDLFVAPTTTFVDFRATSNRRLFLGLDGSTQFLGDNGERPFGTVPPIFLTLSAPVPDNWPNNAGYGAAFTRTGPDLELAGSRPPCGTYTIDDPLAVQPPGVDPQIQLSVSDDGGRTFSTLQKWRSLGKVGEYTKRLRWLKMGMFRQRQIRLEITDPVRRNIIGIYQDVSVGLDM